MCLPLCAILNTEIQPVLRRRTLKKRRNKTMLETLLTLPGFIYQADGKYYFLGKWICKECTDMDATDCVTMYQMSRDAKEEKEASLYFQKIRAYSDFALEVPYDPEKIRTGMGSLLEGLSDQAVAGLEKQIQQVQEDMQ